jgi:Zn-dependent protease/CBS domain-containing protein
MSGTRWQLFRLFGIPVSIDASWLIILALLTWTLSELFASEISGLPIAGYWLMGLIATLAFFACVLLHKMGHALVSRATGSPIRGITLFLFGGVAEMEGEPKSALNEFLMAIAGPVVSAVLAACFWLLSGFGWPREVELVLLYLAQINLLVLLFNLVPAFPLDGGRVFRSALWGATGDIRRATRWASYCGQGFAWILIGLGVLNLIDRHFAQGIWLGLIGLFLNTAARGSYQQVLIQQTLGNELVARFMHSDPVVVREGLNLREWVEEYVYRHHCTSFPVVARGKLVGAIGTRDLTDFPREEWPEHTVEEVMRRDLEAITVRSDSPAIDALKKMQNSGADRLLVVDHEQLIGVVSAEDLLGYLSLKLTLEPAAR